MDVPPDFFGREVKSSEVPIAERPVIGSPLPRQRDRGASRMGEFSRVISTVGQKGSRPLGPFRTPEADSILNSSGPEASKPGLRSTVRLREVPVHRAEATRRYFDSTRVATRTSGSSTVTRGKDGKTKITSILDESGDFEPSGF